MPNVKITDVNSIHGFFITYRRFIQENKIFSNISKWSNCSNIDIYVDMNSATKELFYNKPPINGEAEIASTILNLCGHYRDYYRRYHQCETRFFIIYSINRPRCCSNIFDEYNSSNIMKQMAKPVIYDMITKACLYLDSICKYIPDVFFIYSDYETPVVIYDSIENRQNKPYPSLVITKDLLGYEIIAFSDKCIIARPYKSMTSDSGKRDLSYFITSKDALSYAISDSKFKLYSEWRNLSPALLSLVYTIHGLKSRNIPILLTMKETMDLIYKGVSYGDILNGYNIDIRQVYDKLNIGGFGVDFKTINERFQILDIITQCNIMRNELSLGVDDYDIRVVNIDDPDKVKHMNNTTFANCPIALDIL